MNKKQSSFNIKTFTNIMLILASFVVITCGIYFLYEKYETHKLTEEKSSKKKYSICFEDTICFYIEYKLIGNNLYYELNSIYGLKYIKEKYKDYYRDRFVDNNHKIKWKKYFKEEKPKLSDLHGLAYTKEFEIDKFRYIIGNVKKKDPLKFLILNLFTEDGIEMYQHAIILSNTSNTSLTSSSGKFYVSYQSTEKINLTEEVAKNFSHIAISWHDKTINAIVKKF